MSGIYSLVISLILSGQMLTLEEINKPFYQEVSTTEAIMEENLSVSEELEIEKVVSKETSSNEELVDEALLTLINDLRISNELNPLKEESWLEEIAEIRAIEANEYWSHTRPDGSDSLDMIPMDKWAGENLSFVTYGKFEFTPEEVKDASNFMFKMLCESPTHLDNMLFEEFKTIGIETYVSTTETGNIKLCTAYIFSN